MYIISLVRSPSQVIVNSIFGGKRKNIPIPFIVAISAFTDASFKDEHMILVFISIKDN